MEPAGNTQPTVIVQQAGPGRSGSFCYICNKLTTLHFFGLWYLGVEMRFFKKFVLIPQKRKPSSSFPCHRHLAEGLPLCWLFFFWRTNSWLHWLSLLFSVLGLCCHTVSFLLPAFRLVFSFPSSLRYKVGFWFQTFLLFQCKRLLAASFLLSAAFSFDTSQDRFYFPLWCWVAQLFT